ncbi:MAG TPA: hypothetical protein VM369_02475 [Candidatus Binatia bacterium]|nr:hypothetical protein [Candidatus Binatia bacterium]
MLEAWLLAAVASAAPAAAPAPPPLELLEFVGEWSPQEQQLIDTAARAQQAQRPRGNNDGHANDDASNPPR